MAVSTTVRDSEVELTDDEMMAYNVIMNENGLHQSELWKELDISSRKGSRLCKNLEEKGVLKREETVYNGYVTYYLETVEIKKDLDDLDFSLLMAGDMMSPFVNQDKIDIHDSTFSAWIMNLAAENEDMDSR